MTRAQTNEVEVSDFAQTAIAIQHIYKPVAYFAPFSQSTDTQRQTTQGQSYGRRPTVLVSQFIQYLHLAVTMELLGSN